MSYFDRKANRSNLNAPAMHLLIPMIVTMTLVPMVLSAQFKVYGSAEDLLNNTPTVEYPDHEFHSIRNKNSIVRIKRPDEKELVELDCTKIWGFSYKDRLFRVLRRGRYYPEGDENYPIMLSAENGMFYWIFGNHLKVVRDGGSYITLEVDRPSYISATVDGDLALVRSLLASASSVAGVDALFAEHPEFQWIQDCNRSKMKRGYLWLHMEECIKDGKPPE